MGWLSNIFGGGDDSTDDSTDDYDAAGNFIPGPGFYNVSQEERPIKHIADDRNSSYWETDKGNLVKTKPVDNEGDD
jgi:hypothetical protein